MREVRIGCFGLQGHQILGYLPSLERARLTALGGLTEAEAETMRRDYPDVPLFPDLDSMIEKGEVDLISLCTTPRSDQARLVVRALQSGKHVLAEKPMATAMGDLAALRQAVSESGKELRTMTPMPYAPQFVGMRKVVESGAVGSLVQIYAMKSYPYHDARPQDRRVDGGIILQAGIHAVSLIRSITGLEFAEVLAQDTGTGNPKRGDLQMAAHVAFRMNSGALGVILCNYCNPNSIGYHGNDQLRYHGTKGMIELVDGGTRRMLVLRDEKPQSFDDVAPEKRYPQDLIDCILDGTPTLLSQEDSFRNTEIVIRAQESATKGVPLKVSPCAFGMEHPNDNSGPAVN